MSPQHVSTRRTPARRPTAEEMAALAEEACVDAPSRSTSTCELDDELLEEIDGVLEDAAEVLTRFRQKGGQ